MHIYFAGIDIGSTMTKVVILDSEGYIYSVVKGPTGPEHRRLAYEVLQKGMRQAELCPDNIVCIVATGYGRMNVPFADFQITELSCHACGVARLFPNAQTAIDIGGQDSKCMKIRQGKLVDFVMNDKCAAGTGRFLEITAATLGVRLDEIGPLSLKSAHPRSMSNMCTIFAQQELVAGLSEGAGVEDILAGLHSALSSRIAAMAKRLRIEPEVVLTGGVAKNAGVVAAMRNILKTEIHVPEEPLITGALGAALFAREQARRISDGGKSQLSKRHAEGAFTTFFST